jgi:hypothetical protein
MRPNASQGFAACFFFIAGTRGAGAIALAAFGPRTLSAHLVEAGRQRVSVPA